MSDGKAGDVEGEEDGIQEREGGAERVSDSCHRLGSICVNPGLNSGENGVGNPVWFVSILDSHRVWE